MKKIISILFTAALALPIFAAGCSDGKNESGKIPDNSDNASVGTSSAITITTKPADKTPDGEPTFLTAPDGTPIYTSEISEIYSGSEEDGDKKTITLEQAAQLARNGEDFTVKCDGFVYVYIPERAKNHKDDPELFETLESGAYAYIGETFDTDNLEGPCSYDYTRLNVGDKFGSLTVKSAYTLFGIPIYDIEADGDLFDIPGAYISQRYVEFDGEVELTGYVSINPTDAMYGVGGDMKFYPDGESSQKLPGFTCFPNKNSKKVCHFSSPSYDGFYGDKWFDIGNMFEVGCDTSALRPGDDFVKVRVTLGNIRYIPGYTGRYTFELKKIEVI